MITEAKDLRKKIMSGVVPSTTHRARAEPRRRHKEIAAHVPSIKIAYDGAAKTIEDSAIVTQLTSKFGSLQQ